MHNYNVRRKQNSITRINRTNLQRKYRSFDELKPPSNCTRDPRCQILYISKRFCPRDNVAIVLLTSEITRCQKQSRVRALWIGSVNRYWGTTSRTRTSPFDTRIAESKSNTRRLVRTTGNKSDEDRSRDRGDPSNRTKWILGLWVIGASRGACAAHACTHGSVQAREENIQLLRRLSRSSSFSFRIVGRGIESEQAECMG